MKTFLLAGVLSVTVAGAVIAQAMDAQTFVDQAAAGGLFEVQSSELALARSQTPNIQSFAETMISDHTAANEELTSIAEAEGLTVPTEITGQAAEHMAAVDAAEGAAFDPTYVEHQVAAHEAAIELYQSYTAHGDVEALASFAESMLPVLQQHLEMARGLGPH